MDIHSNNLGKQNFIQYIVGNNDKAPKIRVEADDVFAHVVQFVHNRKCWHPLRLWCLESNNLGVAFHQCPGMLVKDPLGPASRI